MILKTDLIKPACSTILAAVDSSDLTAVAESLELETEENVLKLNVNNSEYYVRVNVPITTTGKFRATVNAMLFLKLIAQTTSEDIELTVEDGKTLVVKGNGTYTLPLIFEGEEVLHLKEITINNPTSTFNIDSAVLDTIRTYNSKELSKGIATKLSQRMYYVDEKGCITFTPYSACVNNFTLEKPIKILLSPKVVKLFKLFSGDKVKFTLGYDQLGEVIQTKVKFETDTLELTAILSCDDTLLGTVPADAIRGRIASVLPNTVVVNRDVLNQALNRIMLFAANKEEVRGIFTFETDKVTISYGSDTVEPVPYANGSNVATPYVNKLDLVDLKLILDGCKEQYLTMNFGQDAVVEVSRGNIHNVIREITD